MAEKVEVEISEVEMTYRLIGRLVEFFHQPMNYPDGEAVLNFLSAGTYEEMAHLFYDVIPRWLPSEIQADLREQ